MTTKPLIVYHYPCADGFTAAYAAHLKFGDNAEYFPGDYSKRAILPNVDGKTVYILDFSYEENVMRELAERAHEIIVLDHHVSAEKSLRPLLDKGIIGGEFDMNRSGATMAWDYFHPSTPRPRFVDYVEDRDLWRFNLPLSKSVNQAIFAYEYTFKNWDLFKESGIDFLMEEGAAILRAHMKNVKEINQQHITLHIQGYDVPAVNTNYTFGSDAAGLLCDGHPFAAYFWVNSDKRYVFGLRSKEGQPQAVDVSEIARKYPGGGGHKHASGFTVNSLNDL